jgi:hypothetical protein
VSYFCQKPFSTINREIKRGMERGGGYMYGPGNPPSALNANAVSSVMTGPPTSCESIQEEERYDFCGLTTFMTGYILCGALDFIHWLLELDMTIE